VYLSLAGSQVTDMGLAVLSELKALTELNLSSTKVSDACMKTIASLPLLMTLNVAETRIGDIGVMHLAGHRKLQILDLSGTMVTDASLAYLVKLAVLRLARTKVRFDDFPQEGYRSLIGFLDLSENQVTGLANVAKLPRLENLTLNGAKLITPQGLSAVSMVPTLRVLGLFGVTIPNADISKIKDSRSQSRKSSIKCNCNRQTSLGPQKS
jgi:hypothetical protein